VAAALERPELLSRYGLAAVRLTVAAGPAGIWLEPPLLCPVISYWPAGTCGPGHGCVCPGVHESCPQVIEKLCDQFAASTVGPVKVDGHPVDAGAALDHTNAPAALSMLTTGHA
jgi:hypothetical protein